MESIFIKVKNVVRLNERRVIIGWELDDINTWWSRDEKSYYKSTNVETGEKEHKFNHEKHPLTCFINLCRIKKEKSIDWRLETKSTDALSLYVSIIDLHRTIKDWFEDRNLSFPRFLVFLRVVNFSGRNGTVKIY